MGKVVLYSTVSVDGFVADEDDQPGPLFDWLSSGDVPLDEGWTPEAPFHFVEGIERAMAKAQQLAGDRTVEVSAGDVGGQFLAARLVDEVAMDVALRS